MSTFNDLSLDDKMVLKVEFDHRDTPRERRAEILTLLREGANEAEMGTRCPKCKNYPFFAPHDEAIIEGHVYSHDGMEELRITGYCEFCFDKITQEPDEDDWKQDAIAEDLGFMAKSMGPDTTVRRLSDEEAREMFNEEEEL